MAGLTRWAGPLVLALAASCATAPISAPSAPKSGQPAGPPVHPERLLRVVAGPGQPESGGEALAWVSPRELDLGRWPSGWVDDPELAALEGLPPRFWSERRLAWRAALEPGLSPAVAAHRLEPLAAERLADDEAARAALRLWRLYQKASLPDDARRWLDTAWARRPDLRLAVERAWDQGYRLGDWLGARALWEAVAAQSPDPAAVSPKAALLQKRLFLRSRSLVPFGGDDYVSTLVLDRDDLWVGTWNGAVLRWSLTTDATDLVLAPQGAVAPVKRLERSRWFLYAFQEASLLRYSKVTGTWRTFSYPDGWTGLRVQDAWTDEGGTVWVAYLGLGLWRFDEGAWTLVDAGGAGPFLNALAPDGLGGFWIGTKDQGLWSWSDGAWTRVAAEGRGPVNISVVVPEPGGRRVAVGTWGEGAWLVDGGRLRRVEADDLFVTGADWTAQGPVWGTLEGVRGPGGGPPAGSVSALKAWEGRWIWGQSGGGLAWWTEHENPALLR